MKARQLGITTFFCIYLLDKVLWYDNVQCGIIAHTLDDSSNIFKDKLKYAFDHLHPEIRPLFKLVGDSAKELSFKHGSVIRVGTSLRSSTLQHLHISEFGKICAKNPEKAREIVTGSLNTVHVGQNIYIESTAEGKEGAFHSIWDKSWNQHTTGATLGPLDYNAFFFPWHKHPEYTIGTQVDIPHDLKEYFDKLYINKIRLSDMQKWWYVSKYDVLKEDMFREYPSTPQEAFQASQEGYWYASYIKELYDNGRVTNVSHDRALPVHTAWDLGQKDPSVIIFFQINRSGDINVFDFWQKNNTPLDQIAIMLKSKGYNYGTHIWPHDAAARDRAGVTFQQQAYPLGITGTILDPHPVIVGINLVKTTLSRMWFDKNRCMPLLQSLENYKKHWNSSFGGYTDVPVHDDASHASDALRYLVAGIQKVQASSSSLENDYKALRSYFR